MKFIRKFAALFRRTKLDAEMAEEMRLHLERRTEENVASGMSPEEARFAALRKFGGVEQAKEVARDQRVRRFVWLEQASQDLRYATKALRKTPGFTLTAILTLALGIGVNAALFTVYNSVALRSLPSREPDELVNIRGTRVQARGFSSLDERFSYLDYLDYRAETRAFADLVAWTTLAAKLDDTASRADPLLETKDGYAMLQAVSGNYFSALGGEIFLGRDFLPEEIRTPDAHPVIVLGHRFWQARFQSDPNVLGRTLAFDDLKGAGRRAYTVIGVAAPEFVGRQPVPPAGWIPLMMQPREIADRRNNAFEMIGRLKPDVTWAQAKAELDAIAQRLAQAFPDERRKTAVLLEPAMRWFNFPLTLHHLGETSPLLLGFAMVLVIACLNVANLLLARGVTRQQEIGIRLTLGATRARVVRQLLTENLLLCLLGAGGGLVLATWALHALRPIAISSIPANQGLLRNAWSMVDLSPDYRVAIFIAALVLIAGIAAGLAPALHASRSNVVSALKDEGSAFGRRLSRSKLRNLLIIAQMALCLTLLSCAGFMVRNFLRLRATDLGFEPKPVFSAGLTSKLSATKPRAALAELRGVVETLRTLPGVTSACFVRWAPLVQRLGDILVKTPGEAASDSATKARYTMVSAGFFETFGIQIQRGRGFTSHEVETDARVVVVSEATARRLWPGQEAVGKILALGDSPNRNAKSGSGAPPPEHYRDYEVIGVARDIRSNEIWRVDETLLFLPPPTDMTGTVGLFVHSRSDSAASLPAIADAAKAAGIPLEFTGRLATQIEERLTPVRVLAWLFGVLGALALLLAGIGLYGVMSFAVNQRVREIGIRVALGATTEKIYALVLSQGMRLVAVGIGFGLIGGGLFSLLLSKILVGKQDLRGPFDSVGFGTVALILSIVALVACWLPARRATKVDPMVALRAE